MLLLKYKPLFMHENKKTHSGVIVFLERCFRKGDKTLILSDPTAGQLESKGH
jgi:hypothetical protein